MTARAKHNIINTFIEGVATLDKIVRKRPKLQKNNVCTGKELGVFFFTGTKKRRVANPPTVC